MVQAIGARWRIEESFESGKALGLEDYEVRTFRAWYRYITLVMLVAACLAVIWAQMRMQASVSSQAESACPTYPLLPLTISEVQHLLALLLWPPPRSAVLVLSWSWWRRCHQSRASYFHTKRRCASGKCP
jgi:hypothetical protein